MANLSNYAENAILDGTAMPATLYAQMHTGDPGEDGTSNVSTHTTRVSTTRTAASGGACTAAADVSFTNIQVTPASETITHVTLWSASSNGNCWSSMSLLMRCSLSSLISRSRPTGTR